MPPLSQSILHRELETLLAGCSAGELMQLIIDLGDEEHPRNRRPFLERIRRHRCSADTAPTEISAEDELQTQIDSLAMEIAAIAEAEDAGWYDEEDGLGPFAESMPRVHDLLDRVRHLLVQGRAASAQHAYERLWSILEVEDDVGRRPSLEEADLDLAREHAARYLRAVFLACEPGERPEAMLCAAARVRFSGITARPATLYLTLQEIEEVEATPLPDWDAFLDALIAALAEPQDILQDMWVREAFKQRQGVAGMAALARCEGAGSPEAWLDWVREAVQQGDTNEAVAAWQEAQGHFPRRAEIWGRLADLILPGDGALDAERRADIAFEALVAKPTPQRLLTLWAAVPDDKKREACLREVARCLQETPPEQTTERCRATLERPGSHLATPSAFERRISVAVLAWLLIGEWQPARDLAERDAVVGWSFGDNARRALFCCVPMALAGGPVGEAGAATQVMWRQLAQDGMGPLGVLADWPAEAEDGESAGQGAEASVSARLGDALVLASQCHPLPPSDAMTWLQWCFNTARARCHAIVSPRHRKAYGRAACAVMASVETATAMGHANAGRQFLREIRSRYPRHTAFQRALDEYGSR